MKLDTEELRLIEYHALRDEAWTLLRDDLAALREDLERRGLGARLADRVGEEARDVWDQTLDVAAAHRGVVAGTVLALVAWLLRVPIAHGVGALFGSDEDGAEPAGERRVGDDEGERT